MATDTADGAPALPRRTWLGIIFGAVALASALACVTAAGDADWLAFGRRSTFAGFFALYAYGHFRWPHTRWPRHGETTAAVLVITYLVCVGLSMAG